MWKKITDAGIVLCAAALAVYVAVEMTDLWKWPLFVFLMALSVFALNNLIDQFTPHEQERKYADTEGTDYGVRELILLDENEKPVKAWNLAGRVSLLIGRDNPKEPVDVDLEECEYSALIDEQHAVLNYCMDAWYVEDLNSMNGIRVRKISDGLCYRVSRNRPCRLESGDLLFIANTKLLIT